MRIFLRCLKAVVSLALISVCAPVIAQTTVFNDDFTVAQGTVYTTAAGPIGTSDVWRNVRSGTDFGSGIANSHLSLTNDTGASANYGGWVMGYANTSGFAAPYSPAISANPGIVTWTFNMRQSSTNPSGFASSGYGAAFILAGTAGTTNLTGTGYAVILGNSGTVDPIRLVRYNAGIRNFTSLISSNTSGLTDFGNQYISVRVTYNPATEAWQLFVRNDGTTTAGNPATGTLVSQGTVVNNTYTSTALGILGGYYNAGIVSSRTAFFDFVKVTVESPVTTSIAPSSKIAGTAGFTLTVNGSGFLNGFSSVRWNGAARTTTYVSPTQLTATITAADIAASGTASVTVVNANVASNAQIFTIEPAGIPVLTPSAAILNTATTITGTASAALTYTLSGVNLTADAVLTAPANFEISVNGTTYLSSLTLGRTGNNLTGQPLTIYARLKSTALPGSYTGAITHASTGATTKQVVLNGKALAAQPTAQGTTLTFSAVTSASFKVNWTNGNGTARVLVIRAAAAVNGAPVDGETYTASTIFGTGEETTAGNYVVYAGSGNTATVTGLQPATVYHVALYEFNGSAGVENYLTSTPLIGNRTTLNAPLGWQIYAENAVNVIDFDDTVEGVNTNAFQGAGLSAASESGALVSNAWAISGFSDGSLNFGADSAEDSDFDRGTSDGNETEAGLYAFETAADNFSLGIKPGTGDFVPGSVTLKIQNQTGAALTSLNIGYKIYQYNNTNSATNFNFSYSTNNTTYVDVPGMVVSSAAAADAVPSWKGSYRVTTITGLNIPANQYAYIRWSGATLSGSGSFDAFAIDDVALVANPATTFVPFAGTAENFILLGNAQMSGDLTLNGNLAFAGGKLDVNGKVLSLNGTVTNTVAGGIKGSATSSVVTGGVSDMALSFDQTLPGTSNLLKDLSIYTAAPTAVALSNAVAVNGTLLVDDSRNLNLGTSVLSGTLTSISNNGTIFTQNTSIQPVPAGKNWAGTGIFHYNAAAQVQTVAAGTYQNLTISSTGGGVAGGNLTVNGILNLPSANPNATTGSFSTGNYTLQMGPNAQNIGTGDVSGIVSRNSIAPGIEYSFGHKYTSIFFGNTGTLPSSLSIKITLGTAPSWRTGAIKRVYDFIQTGGAGTKAVIKSHYLDSELNGNNEARLVDWTYRTATGVSGEQGRSNYNTTDNFVDLTNVDVAFFSNAFNSILLTMDESEAAVLTWNGSVSSSWTTIGNWTPNATPSDNTIVIIPDAATTPNDPSINPLTPVGSLHIEAGGIVSVPTGAQLTVYHGAGAWINQGTFNPGTGTSGVTFTNPDTTIAGATNFNNITVNSGAGLRPLSGNVMRIAGTFSQNGSFYTGSILNTVEYTGSGQTIAIPVGSLRTAYNNLIISGTGSIFPASMSITGNLTLNQPVNFAGKTIVMAGAGPQTIGGTATPVFNNLTTDNGGEVSLLTNTTVNGTLTLTSGNLNIGNQDLTLGVNPVAGNFDVTRMIIAEGTGKVRRPFAGTGSYFFPIGEKTSNPAYSPISVNVTSGTFSNAYVGVSVTDAIHPDNHSTSNYISRYWNVTQTGITAAIATITANYIAPEVLAPESSMVAAQLTGTFNQQTNPWVRYQPLSGLTLTAVGAPLAAGQISVFTGIKGGDFTALITGYGAFCTAETVNLTAETTGGDGPFTYLWSAGLGTAQIATPPTSTVGTTNYTLTVKDANGITASDAAQVTIVGPSIAGTISPNQNSCALASPNDIVLNGYTGTILYWQSAMDSGFSNPVNISNTTATLAGSQMGILTETTYFRAVVKNGSCSEVYSAPSAVIIKSTAWDGNNWSNGAPDGSTSVQLNASYTASADINACTMTVSNNAIVVIPAGYNVTLNGPVNVVSGSFTLENNTNLIQLTNVQNSGNIKVKRTSSPLFRLDYTMWSSPVFGTQTLRQFSPNTSASRFYTFNSAENVFSSCDPDAVTFEKGTGYLIRIRNNHVDYSATAIAQTWTGTFEGRPNNGPVSVIASVAGQRYNLVGNPYASMIDADAFLEQNNGSIEGTVYFWRRRNNVPADGEMVSAYYATYTKAGGVGVDPVAVASATSQVPNGYIQAGQGFLVKTLDNPLNTEIRFDNSMRSAANNDGQFFKSATPEKSRIWLNVTNQNGAFGQTLIAYMDGAQNGPDRNDGKFFNDANFALSSIVEGSEYIIQARAPFVNADVVPMNFKTPNPGTYTIAIDHLDGIFAGSQQIYIKDSLTQMLHNLKSGPYQFATEAGNFGDRFEIVYENNLSTTAHTADAKSVIVYKQGGDIAVDTAKQTIDHVEVFDIRGRLLASKNSVNAASCRLLGPTAQQILVVRVVMADGAVVSKKIIF